MFLDKKGMAACKAYTAKQNDLQVMSCVPKNSQNRSILGLGNYFIAGSVTSRVEAKWNMPFDVIEKQKTIYRCADDCVNRIHPPR